MGNSIIPSTAEVHSIFTNETMTQVYHDSVPVGKSLAKGELLSLELSKFPVTTKGTYGGLYFIKYVSDGEASNDTLRNNFKASWLNSVAISQINSPQENEVFQLNDDTVKPIFTVTNTGINDIISPIYYTVLLEESTNEVYRIADSITSLLSEASKTLAVNNYIPTNTGTYNMTVTITYLEEKWDTLSQVFHVSLENDVAAIKFVYPEIDSLVFANRIYAPKGEFINLGDSAQKSDFSVSFLIDIDGVNKYNSSKTINLDSGEALTVVFDSTFNPTEPGLYQMLLVSRLGTDQVESNDTLFGSFLVDFHSSVEQIEQLGIQVYPNPSKGQFIVSTEVGLIDKVTLYDPTGRIVKVQAQIQSNNTEITVSHLITDVYWLKINTGDVIIWKKIIIE
ncbi:MAG: hypothetical protein ACI9JN_001557 [Bacteroidia bacterium]